MKNLAFICHSSSDAAIANKIVVELEKAGIACWIAPRNIKFGTTYAAAIVQGIKKSNLFIFIFSKSANNSDAIINEIENANALKIPIIPFKVDKEDYSDSLDYYLRSKQSVAAYDKSVDQAISELIQSINTNVPTGTTPPLSPSPPHPLPQRHRLKKWLIPAFIVLLLGVSLVIYFVVKNPKEPPITVSFLKGTWINEFGNGGSSENVKISGDGRYYVNGVYSFSINNFEYDKIKRQIRFVKASVLDQRNLLNTLTVENNNMLVGTEANYPVKYTKLSD